MRKQLSIVMIALSWVLWFAAVFAFPISSDASATDFSRSSVSHIKGLVQVQFNAGAELVEIPEFKVDWSLNAKLNPSWHVGLISPSKVRLSSSFFKKSVSLFDVKETFKHFFHTW